MKKISFIWHQQPLTRMSKYRHYRQAIMRMKPGQFQEANLRTATPDVGNPLPKAIGVMMWLLGGMVIILLIVVSALVYFGR